MIKPETSVAEQPKMSDWTPASVDVRLLSHRGAPAYRYLADTGPLLFMPPPRRQKVRRGCLSRNSVLAHEESRGPVATLKVCPVPAISSRGGLKRGLFALEGQFRGRR
jgi:hypothetical protein